MGNTLILMILNLLGKIFSFGREMVFSYFYGAGDIKDAFNTSVSAAMMIFNIITVALAKTFIPSYNKVKAEKGEKEADTFTSTLLNFSMFLSTIVLFFAMIFAPYIVKIFAVGYKAEKLRIASIFMRAVLLSIYANIYAAIFSSYLQIKGDFISPALPLLLMNIILAITVAVSKGSIMIMAVGIFLAYTLQFVLMPRAVRNAGYKYKNPGKIKDKDVINLIRLSIPTTFTMAGMYISTMVDQSFASLVMPTGGVSVIDYSQKILRIVSGVFLVPFQTTIYPKLGRLVAERKNKDMNELMQKTLTITFIFFIPCLLGLMSLSNPIIKFVYQRGKFTATDTLITGGVLFFYAPYLLGPAFTDLLNLGFFSNRDTKTPTVISMISIVINIIMDFVLAKTMGINGLALATTVSVFIAAIITAIAYRKRFGAFDKKSLLINLIKLLLAGFVMVLVAKLILAKIPTNLGLLIAIVVSAAIYMALIVILKVDHIHEILGNLKKKIRR